MSVFDHRIVLVCPEANAVTLATWLNENLQPDFCPANLGPGLSPDGNEPITHRWCGVSLDDRNLRLLAFRLRTLAGMNNPTQAVWRNWTASQKRQHIRQVLAIPEPPLGIRAFIVSRAGRWDSPTEILQAIGLRELLPREL